MVVERVQMGRQEGMSQMRNTAGVTLPNLIELRRRKLLSQAELATRAGVGKNTVLRLEKGAIAHYSTARKLAEALDVEPVELMEPRGS